MSTSHSHIFLGRVDTVADFYNQLSAQLFNGTRAIHNADSLADLLQETSVEKVSVAQWNVPLHNALIIFHVFKDLKLGLYIGDYFPSP